MPRVVYQSIAEELAADQKQQTVVWLSYAVSRRPMTIARPS